MIGNKKFKNKLFNKTRLKFTITQKLLGKTVEELYPNIEKMDIISAYKSKDKTVLQFSRKSSKIRFQTNIPRRKRKKIPRLTR